MLVNQKDFDRDVKRVLQEVKGEEIPLDFLVDIEQRLDQLEKKKKRRLLLWFFIGIVLASGLSFGLLRENGTTKSTVKIAQQNVSFQTSKPKVLKQLAASKGNRTVKTTNVQSAAVIAQSVVKRNIPSSLPKKATKNRIASKTHSNVIQSTQPLENIVSVQTQTAEMETIQNSQDRSSHLKSVEAPATELVTGETSSKIEIQLESATKTTAAPDLALQKRLPKWTRTMGFFVGMSGIRSSVDSYDNSGMNSGLEPTEKYLSIRNAQERSTSSIDLSLRTSWMKKHFLIQTGVDYFEWGEQLQYDYNIVYDGVNRYSYVAFPLYLGYRQTLKKVELSASIGSSFGGAIKRDGYYLQQNLTTIASEQASDWTLTGYLQFELSYLIENYRFSIAPTYRKALTYVIFSNQTVNSYDSFGLQMGISVILK
ncbi:MAG: hypothetical protein WCH03_06265 [Flavobacteriia bacterium]